MDKIKESLTKKIGPLPAWIWLTLFGVGYYYYKSRQASTTGTGTGSVTPTPPTPQAPLDIPAGDSVYDPNTGAFDTAPGGGGSGSSSGDTTGGTPSGGSVPAGLMPALHNISKQLGRLNRKPKPKTGSKKTKKTIKPKGTKKGRPRSTATIKNQRRSKPPAKNPGVHMTSSKGKPLAIAHVPRNRTATQTSRPANVRQRPTTPATRTTMRQRPVASAKPAHRDTTRPAVTKPPQKAPPRKQRKK